MGPCIPQAPPSVGGPGRCQGNEPGRSSPVPTLGWAGPGRGTERLRAAGERHREGTGSGRGRAGPGFPLSAGRRWAGPGCGAGTAELCEAPSRSPRGRRGVAEPGNPVPCRRPARAGSCPRSVSTARLRGGAGGGTGKPAFFALLRGRGAGASCRGVGCPAGCASSCRSASGLRRSAKRRLGRCRKGPPGPWARAGCGLRAAAAVDLRGRPSPLSAAKGGELLTRAGS